MADIIRRLPPQVANLIAAGEVVERPASVVKELCENAVDAGATAITVEIRHGGLTYIRVTDNGRGMSPADARTAFLRHATSKISSENDLDAIGTRGFRGEALAAIGAVSKVQLLTREKGELEGTVLELEAGAVTNEAPAGCPEGTTMIVRDLFFNTPARMKYMKKDAYEAAACVTETHRQALSRPDVSFTLIRDDVKLFRTAGDSSLENCIYTTLGREFSSGMTRAGASGEGVTVEGFVSKPIAVRGNRAGQYFFVNGRPVRSRSLAGALEEGYQNMLSRGRFPACVLNVTVRLSAVDVNVHPAKAEVKFASEREVYSVVYHAALSAVGAKEAPPSFTRLAPPPQPGDKPWDEGEPGEGRVAQHNYRPLTTQGYKEYLSHLERLKAQREARPAPEQAAFENMPENAPENIPAPPSGPENAPAATPAEKRAVFDTPEKPVPFSLSEEAPAPAPGTWRVVGEAMDTYVLVEEPGGLLIIDKHAAHERILFEKYRSRDERVMSQRLISPMTYFGGGREGAVLLENAGLLAETGFEVEDFGAGTVIVRAVPADVSEEDAVSLLDDIAQRLLEGKSGDFTNMRDALLHMMACKAAIKGGDINSRAEIESLVEQVVTRSDVRYCPHGRPVAMALGRNVLDRHFKRS